MGTKVRATVSMILSVRGEEELLAMVMDQAGLRLEGRSTGNRPMTPNRATPAMVTALAIQAGIGNFGVSVVQFLTPWLIGFALFGTLAGDPQTFTKGAAKSDIWLQNAAAVYIPFIVVFAALAWLFLRSVPVRANFREQLDIFKMKHAFFMTLLYIMTFGSFSGLSATFPLLIRQIILSGAAFTITQLTLLPPAAP